MESSIKQEQVLIIKNPDGTVTMSTDADSLITALGLLVYGLINASETFTHNFRTQRLMRDSEALAAAQRAGSSEVPRG